MILANKKIDLSTLTKPFRYRNSPIWSIKVFHSNHFITSLMNDDIDIPSLKPSDVTDIPAEFIADPFIIFHKSKFYMFFEVLNKNRGKGEIGLATSLDGVSWHYEKIVLREEFHLSYPQVFKFKDEIYMIPETYESNEIILYKANNLLDHWEKVCPLIRGSYVDPSIFEYDNKWWMYTGTPDSRNLHLFYSNDLKGPWTEHPKSPLISDNLNISRPGGRVIVEKEGVFRYTQDCGPYYGHSLRGFKIKNLSETDYEEEEIGVVFRGNNNKKSWRRDGMHQIDQLKISEGNWLIAVDGHKFHRTNYTVLLAQKIVTKILRTIRKEI